MSKVRAKECRRQEWRPMFPEPKDKAVRIFNDECDINLLSSNVVITTKSRSSKDKPIDPACFCIDDTHIYIRRNWESWLTVNTANKFFVNKLMNSPRCTIYDTVDGAMTEYNIPIYNIFDFPHMLFKSEQLDETLSSALLEKGDDGLKSDMPERPTPRLSSIPPAISECMEKLEADIFPNVIMDGHLADLAFSTDRVAVLCSLWKSENPVDAHKLEDDLDYIKGELLSNEPDSECHMVLLADSPGMVKPKCDTTMVMTEKGLIGFLKEIFKTIEDTENEV